MAAQTFNDCYSSRRRVDVAQNLQGHSYKLHSTNFIKLFAFG